MMPRRTRRAIVVFGVVIGLGGAWACVLADPPAELPVVPVRAPHIVHTGVVPPVTGLLQTWPLELVVPIEADPTSSVQYQLFIDYDPVTQQGEVQHATLDPVSGVDAGTRVLVLRPRQPASEECHTLELIVALNFEQGTLHTPDPSGGDSVTWFYVPSGMVNGCPIYDAGPGDAGSDGEASAAGAEGGAD